MGSESYHHQGNSQTGIFEAKSAYVAKEAAEKQKQQADKKCRKIWRTVFASYRC
jgi:hypothetical protein